MPEFRTVSRQKCWSRRLWSGTRTLVCARWLDAKTLFSSLAHVSTQRNSTGKFYGRRCLENLVSNIAGCDTAKVIWSKSVATLMHLNENTMAVAIMATLVALRRQLLTVSIAVKCFTSTSRDTLSLLWTVRGFCASRYRRTPMFSGNWILVIRPSCL